MAPGRNYLPSLEVGPISRVLVLNTGLNAMLGERIVDCWAFKYYVGILSHTKPWTDFG